jgi:hypothetical protein
MKHDNVSKVVPLIERRADALALIEAARSGFIEPVWIVHEGRRFKAQPIVHEEHLRQSIMESAYEFVETTDKELNSLGVSTPKEIERPETLQKWKEAAEMYLRVWVREMGGCLKNKRHLIDALCLTTRDMYEKAQLHSVPVVPKEVYDARVTELLKFNNKAEERARAAERKLKEFMAGTPAARLAMAVEMAATNTLSAIRNDRT